MEAQTLEPLVAEPTLSTEEQEEFARCEDTIRQGWQSFIEVGEALLRIREQKLFRDRYEHFEDYYREAWQYQKSQVYRLMDAAKVVRVISPIGEEPADGHLPRPTAEAQVRPLVGLDEKKIRSAWRQAAEAAEAKGGPITGRLVQSQVRAIVPPVKPPPEAAKASRSQKGVDHIGAIRKALDKLVGMIEGNKEQRKKAQALRHQILRLVQL